MPRSENPFRYFDSSPEVIRLVVMMYVKYPLSLRKVLSAETPRAAAGVIKASNVPSSQAR